MIAHRVTPILNVSDIAASFEWFEKLGWQQAWDWGSPPTFGGVVSGLSEIYLCLDGQGGRGRDQTSSTFGVTDEVTAGNGAWLMYWVEDVDALYPRCLEQGIEVTWPPTDMPWNAREMHVRHPDGHVLRIGRKVEEAGK